MKTVYSVSLFLCFAVIVFLALPARASEEPPSGTYAVSGVNSTDATEKYAGSLEVTRTGDVYTIEGTVDGEQFHGVGLYDKPSKILSFVFTGEEQDEPGLTVLKWDGKRLKGHWIYQSTPQDVGSEEWTPAK